MRALVILVALSFAAPAAAQRVRYTPAPVDLSTVDASTLGGLGPSGYCQVSGGANCTMTGSIVMNTAGGTNASITESGIDRSSGSTETWTLQNSGAGVMNLSVDGSFTGGTVSLSGIASTITLNVRTDTGSGGVNDRVMSIGSVSNEYLGVYLTGATGGGGVRITAGTVANPGLQFAVDADGTGGGLYRPGADQVGIAANGIQAALFGNGSGYINNNGSGAANGKGLFGFGADTSPDYQLDVNGTSDTGSGLEIGLRNAQTNGRAAFHNTITGNAVFEALTYGSSWAGGGTFGGQANAGLIALKGSGGNLAAMAIGNSTNDPLYLITNDTTRVTITGDGTSMTFQPHAYFNGDVRGQGSYGLRLVNEGTGITRIDANSASGTGANIRIASGANATGEVGVDIGSNDTATAETLARFVTDADGTPVVKLSIEGDGSIITTAATATVASYTKVGGWVGNAAPVKPTCDAAHAGAIIVTNDGNDTLPDDVCVCIANGIDDTVNDWISLIRTTAGVADACAY